MQFPRVVAIAALSVFLAIACGGGANQPPRDDDDGEGGQAEDPELPGTGGVGGEGSLGGQVNAGGDGADEDEDGADAGPAVDAAAPPKDAGGSSSPRRSSGCGKPGTGTGSYQRQTVMIAGAQRTYFVWVPKAYDPERAYPVLFSFHGSGGTAPGNGQGVELKAGSEAILVSGQGIGGLWQLGAEGVDVAFFDAMLKDVTSNRCVDERRVFAMGFSRGGAMVNLLGCVRGEVLRAIGPLAGWQPARSSDCLAHISAWFAHGTNDGVVPIAQGIRSRDLFKEHNGCTDVTAPVSPTPCVEHTSCGHGSKLVWCAISGGHGDVINYAAPVIWDFFKRFD